MAIEFCGRAPSSYSKEHIIYKITTYIFRHHLYFELLSEILLEFTTVERLDKEYIEQFILSDYEEEFRNIGDVTEYIDLICELYNNSQDDFSDLRGNLLEFILLRLGPQKIQLTSKCSVLQECRIFENNKRIGEEEGHTDSNLDLVFYEKESLHSKETVKAELIECKAKLDNYLFIQEGKQPPIKQSHYDKLRYLNFLLEYFRDSKDFFILFATFQKNTSNSERNLKRLKFEGLGIINGEHISEQIQLRQPNL
jgi:hypothetical protein